MANARIPSKHSMLFGLDWKFMTRRPFVYTENILPIVLTVLGSEMEIDCMNETDLIHDDNVMQKE